MVIEIPTVLNAQQLAETRALLDSAEWVGPALGEHTATVLAGLGYDATAIARLRAAGTV